MAREFYKSDHCKESKVCSGRSHRCVVEFLKKLYCVHFFFLLWTIMQCESTETPCLRLCLFLRVAFKCNSHRWWTRCHKIPKTRMLWYNFACKICMLCDTVVCSHIICIVPISLSVFWRRHSGFIVCYAVQKYLFRLLLCTLVTFI